MDSHQVKKALETAQAIVMSHGMAAHLSEYARAHFARPLQLGSDSLQADFCMNPKMSVWDEKNFTCTLKVEYHSQQPEERDDAYVQDYDLKVYVRTSAGYVSLENYKARENMVASMMMLCEMVNTVLPMRITEVLKNPEQYAADKKAAYDAMIAARIYSHVGKAALLNLRTEGRPRLFKLDSSYVASWGAFPPAGEYSYNEVRYRNRRGVVKAQVNYLFKVHKGSDPDCVYGTVSRLKS